MSDDDTVIRKAWYVVGRPKGDSGKQAQRAYIVEADSAEDAKVAFAEEFPDHDFVNIF